MNFVLFGVLAAVCVGAAAAMLFSRNPVHSALFLVVNFFSIAGFYVMLDAEFLAAVQVIVYAGAVMVLFLFVIMLLNVRGEENPAQGMRALRPWGFALGLVLLTEIAVVLRSDYLTVVRGDYTPELVRSIGSVQSIGMSLFTRYLFPFELTSVLLLSAVVGSIYLAKRRV